MKRKTTDSENSETELNIENKEKKLRNDCGTNHEKLTKRQDPNSNNLIEEIENEGIDNKVMENDGSETEESENEEIGNEKMRYECRACDATFAQKQGLDRHVDSVHLG